ncbi:histidine kinase dimerization/phosphoacceptor domain -containing protein [Falsigemmobacter faecalis]|uniref:histidine kinase dimerization/phosphoacceptor domain -containing protein n=1 Tax=Falsigemmobacter faecalis TaxID=2488730 RepID=UPI0013157B7E|nr:histidine kinase dimerization/phosphoacceptor domain -containing protein [Falsigemmobacter faecalis]
MTECDREPIHIPGSIQPHGVLLVVDPQTRCVTQGAGRIAERLGVAVWAGQPLEALLGPVLTAAIFSPAGSLPRNVTPPHATEAFDVQLTHAGAELLIELEPAATPELMATILPRLEEGAQRFEQAGDMQSLLNLAAREIRQLTGYDRVMVYRFLADEAGKVVADDIAPGHSSFLNHHFPASDIPAQARALYVRNLVRVIPDACYHPAPLWPPRPADQPLDMSDCSLRSVSPVHLRYLQNMGVAASASFSIVKDGELWGLIACHHFSPRGLSLDVRNGGRALCGALSRQIRAWEDVSIYREKVRLQSYEDQIAADLQDEAAPEDFLPGQLPFLAEMLDADGVALVHGAAILQHGRCPETAEVERLADFALAQGAGMVFATDRLAGPGPRCDSPGQLATGLLALILSAEERWMLLCFRADVLQTINWAGNPHKAASADATGQLNPRASFQSWSEQVRGGARPWSPAEKEAMQRLGGLIQTAWQTRRIRDLNRDLLRTVAEKEGLLKQREFLLGEVNHRVQNSLTIISGFLSMQARASAEQPTKVALAEARHRVAAIALVHRRLYDAEQVQAVDAARYVDDLLDDLLGTVDPGWKAALRRNLTAITVPVDRAINMGLILTELFINASKYAYGGATGPVSVTLLREGDILSLTLADFGRGYSGGQQSSGSRFGSRMMAALVEAMNGTLQLHDTKPGLCATLSVPLESD